MPAWLSWTLAALLSWGWWAVLSKVLGDRLSGAQSQALSTLGTLPILFALWLQRGSWGRQLSRRGLWLAFAGGLVTCVGNIVYYGVLARGAAVSMVIPLTSMYPLVTVLMALVFLRERLNPVQMAGIGFSLVAIWLFNMTGGDGWWSPTLIHVLLPIFLWGLSGFLQKLATEHLAAGPAAFVYLGAFVPVAGVLLLTEPWPGTLSGREWSVVSAIGFLLAFGNLAVLVAFARGGKAAVISPLGALYPLISLPTAVLLLGEHIPSRDLAGIACALASVVALSWEGRPQEQPDSPSKLTSVL